MDAKAAKWELQCSIGDAFWMSPSGKSDETVTVLDSAVMDDVSISIHLLLNS